MKTVANGTGSVTGKITCNVIKQSYKSSLYNKRRKT
jgi:hypothetical protein